MWSRLCSLYSLWTFCTKGVVFHVLQHSLRLQTRASIARFLRPSSSSYPQAIGFAHTQFGSRCIPDYINYAWTLMTSQSSLCFASHSHAFHAVYSFLFVFVLKLFSFHFPFFYSCRSLTLATDSISAFKICAAVAFAAYVPFVHYNETTCMCVCAYGVHRKPIETQTATNSVLYDTQRHDLFDLNLFSQQLNSSVSVCL